MRVVYVVQPFCWDEMALAAEGRLQFSRAGEALRYGQRLYDEKAGVEIYAEEVFPEFGTVGRTRTIKEFGFVLDRPD